MDYKARFYSPTLGRFIQPDSIVPDVTNPQSWNRYSYVTNNPLRYADPTGHSASYCSQITSASGRAACSSGTRTQEEVKTDLDNYVMNDLERYGISLKNKDDFSFREKHAILNAAWSVGRQFSTTRGKSESAAEAFTAIYDPVEFVKTDEFTYTDEKGKTASFTAGCKTGVNTITCADFSYGQFQSDVNNIVHELGHVFNNLNGGHPANLGWTYAGDRSRVLRSFDGIYWQQNTLYDPNSPVATGGEMFGDMLVAWVFNAWNTHPLNTDIVNRVSGKMTTNMLVWLNR